MAVATTERHRNGAMRSARRGTAGGIPGAALGGLAGQARTKPTAPAGSAWRTHVRAGPFAAERRTGSANPSHLSAGMRSVQARFASDGRDRGRSHGRRNPPPATRPLAEAGGPPGARSPISTRSRLPAPSRLPDGDRCRSDAARSFCPRRRRARTRLRGRTRLRAEHGGVPGNDGVLTNANGPQEGPAGLAPRPVVSRPERARRLTAAAAPCAGRRAADPRSTAAWHSPRRRSPPGAS